MAKKYRCDICNEMVDSRGIIGHYTWGHSFSREQASEKSRQIRANSENENSRSAIAENDSQEISENDLRESIPENPENRIPQNGGEVDRIDAALEELISNRIRRERIKTVTQLDREEKESTSNGVDDITKVIQLAESLQSLGKSNDVVTKRDLERAIDELNSSSSGDSGSNGSVLAAAVSSGIDDTELLRELAELENEPKLAWADLGDRFLDSIAPGVSSFLADVGSSVITDRLDQARESRNQNRGYSQRPNMTVRPAENQPQQQPQQQQQSRENERLKQLKNTNPNKLTRVLKQHYDIDPEGLSVTEMAETLFELEQQKENNEQSSGNTESPNSEPGDSAKANG